MRFFTCLAVLVAAAGLARAQTNAPAARQLSLQDAIQSALEKNLDLRITRYNPTIAAATLWGAYGAYDPALSLSGAHNFSMSGGGYNSTIGTFTPPTVSDQNSFSGSLGGTAPWGFDYSLQGNVAETYGNNPGLFDSSRGQAVINLSQSLLKNFWIDSTRLNISVSRNRLKHSELGVKLTVMTTISRVEQAYYDLIAARENVAVQERAVQLAEQLVADNRKRVEVGAMAPLDEKQAESQAASSRAALIAAQNSLAIQQNTLKQLITDDYAKWEEIVLQPTISLTAPIQVLDRQISWSKGLTQRPEMLQAQLDVERQGLNLKYSYNQLFPQLDLVGSYGHNASGVAVREFSDALYQIQQGSRPAYSYGARITLPLANTSARAAYRESKLAREQLLLTLKRLEQSIMVTVDNDIKQAQSSYQQVAATRAAREYASDALDAERKKLESGKSTTYTVLQLQRDLTAARYNEIQALAAYNKALSQLSLDEGSTLDRLGIDWQTR